MKFLFKVLIVVLVITTIPLRSNQIQSEEDLTLKLSRDFGYSSGTGRIQGTFSMHVTGPEDLSSVEFLIDGKVIGESNTVPYRYQFNTDSYEQGVHTISVRGRSVDGEILNSNEIRVEFVSPQEVPQQVLKIILPIFGLVFLISIVTILIPMVTRKGKRSIVPLGSPRTYGVFGGAICPKCKRPFSIHLFGLNVVIGKLDRCPYCGRWSIVRRASPLELRDAELSEIDQIPQSEDEKKLTEKEQLMKEIDESKYQDI